MWRVATRTVLYTVGVLLLLWLFFTLREVLAQVLLAVIISAGMTPIVDRLTHRDPSSATPLAATRRLVMPRALVVIILYATLIAAIVTIGALVIPPAVNEFEDLGRRLPFYVTDFQEWLRSLPERYPFIPAGISEGLPEQLRASATQLTGLLNQAAVVIRLLFGVLGGALNFVFILFLALYITSDASRIRRYLISFLPPERRVQVEIVATHIGDRLGGWVRGQIVLSLIIGGVTLIGLWAIGVRYAVLLSVIAAIGEAVPMVGPIVSAIPAVIVASFQSPFQGLLTLILYVLVQQFENAVVVPKVMERAVALHPLAVILALLIGGQLYGVTGAILSVPVAAALAVVLDEVRRERDANRELVKAVLPALEEHAVSGTAQASAMPASGVGATAETLSGRDQSQPNPSTNSHQRERGEERDHDGA
jgi:predicted PurR-regulated permease PerM